MARRGIKIEERFFAGMKYVPNGGVVGNRLSSEAGRKGFKFLGVLPIIIILTSI